MFDLGQITWGRTNFDSRFRILGSFIYSFDLRFCSLGSILDICNDAFDGNDRLGLIAQYTISLTRPVVARLERTYSKFGN